MSIKFDDHKITQLLFAMGFDADEAQELFDQIREEWGPDDVPSDVVNSYAIGAVKRKLAFLGNEIAKTERKLNGKD